jgi:hypothetical protein
MRHRFGALPVRTSALVALSVLGLLLAGRLISGPSTVRARPPATTLAYRHQVVSGSDAQCQR